MKLSINEAATTENHFFGVFATAMSDKDTQTGPEWWVIAKDEAEAKKIFTEAANKNNSSIGKLVEIYDVKDYGSADKMTPSQVDQSINGKK